MATNFPTSLDSFPNPTGDTKLDGDAVFNLRHDTQHIHANDSLSALEAKIGADFSSVPSSLDYAAQVIESTQMAHRNGGYKEVTYTSGVFPSSISWYVDSGKTIKLLQKDITYGPGSNKFIMGIQWKLYDGTVSNILKRTITDVITRTGIKETSRTRTVT